MLLYVNLSPVVRPLLNNDSFYTVYAVPPHDHELYNTFCITLPSLLVQGSNLCSPLNLRFLYEAQPTLATVPFCPFLP